jgi:hypothetical protein
MDERRPDNLKLLSEAFGGQHVIENIFTGESLVVDGVEFVSGYVAESAPDRFYILKPMHLIERYRELAEFAHGGRVLELGIAEGGSAALLALWADPVMLVTLDSEPTPLVALDDFARAHGFADRLRPFFGVDQGDRARVAEIVDTEFAGEPIDLVIDDASTPTGRPAPRSRPCSRVFTPGGAMSSRTGRPMSQWPMPCASRCATPLRRTMSEPKPRSRNRRRTAPARTA